MKLKAARRLSYEDQRKLIKEFLQGYDDDDSNRQDPLHLRKKYMIRLQAIADEEAQTLQVDLEDLESHFRKEEQSLMLEGFRKNTSRYLDIIAHIAEELMPKRHKAVDPDEEFRHRFENILREQRRDNLQSQNPNMFDQNEQIPISTHKNFDVAIVYGPNAKVKPKAIADLSSEDIGSLVIVKAIVVRASQVKPEIAVATFACDICGCENYLEVLDNNYRPLDKCTSRKCVENRVNGKLAFLPGHSKFRPFQELKIQETPDQLRDGRIPRTYSLQLRESNVKQAAPGDIILVQGILRPNQKLGFRHQGELSFQCFIEAINLKREKKKYVDMSLTEDQVNQIQGLRASLEDSNLFNRMSASIAPEIFGMQRVKQALLLLMAGGVTQETHDLLKIRGEINVALIGDPGIAKSQLLKHISYLAPRAVYTTGKGSSGVGLTAAVVIDPFSKELSLEAGALVLADMGICCIDEFDKMEEYDRTAIHEVMEQQTVSIAKAGITTTLNARTSILAAANPLYGRYNRKQSINKNINLPAALLSRFDLIFVLLDEAEKDRDLMLARHIGEVHKFKRGIKRSDLLSPDFLRAYIAMSKRFEPTISQELHNILISKYIEKRQEQIGNVKKQEKYITTRSLLALIRLCQARARLRFSNEVSMNDITECLDLMQEAQKSVTLEHDDRRPMHDYTSQIFEVLKYMCKYSSDLSVKYDALRKRILAKGHTEQQLVETVENYLRMNVIMKDDNNLTLIEI